MKDILIKLFERHFSTGVNTIRELEQSGSHRRYFRMSGEEHGCIGAYSPDPGETRAFLSFTRHFLEVGLNVPSLLAENVEENVYLLEDLGDLSLKILLDRERTGEEFPSGVIRLYRSALEHLLRFQMDGHVGIDYSVCIPRQEFDRQSILWDLNHFKYYFLKMVNVPFDEQKLEKDFNTLADHLLKANRDHFMFRDFQSRNIMVRKKELYFIDYQGGRRGALQYDVASLLFEARTNLPVEVREELLEFYLKTLAEKSPESAEGFMDHYYTYVLIRILQAMGAYGIRGVVENKALFLQSIPFAIRNLRWLIARTLIPEDLPELTTCLESICRLDEWSKFPETSQGKLRVTIKSFSYRKGLPGDLSGNGGGFVFDCRALPNPGRLEEYRGFSGKDAKVIDYLKDKKEAAVFIEGAQDMVLKSVETYLSMGYTDLMVSFGCTGGQHRSVYCAEQLKEFLQNLEGIEIRLNHRELHR